MAIPRIVHKIWLDGEVPPILRRLHRRMMDLNPEWQFRLWHQGNWGPLVNRKWMEHMRGASFRTDIVRYELLARYGGVYADWDLYPRHPWDDLLDMDHADNFFHRETNKYGQGSCLNNGCFGVSRGNPIAWALVERLDHSARVHREAGGQVDMLGVGYFSRVVKSFPERALILPTELFTDPLTMQALAQPPGYWNQHPLHTLHFYTSVNPVADLELLERRGHITLPTDPGMGGLEQPGLHR